MDSFEAMAEAIPHIVWLAAADGTTDYFNDMGTGYTGFPRQANYGWRWLDLVHPRDIARARLGWEHATRTVTPYSLSYRIRRHDGEYRWHACRALPVRGNDGEILRWIGTADDLDALRVPADDDARVKRQVAELRAMLEVVHPPGAVQPTVVDAEAALTTVPTTVPTTVSTVSVPDAIDRPSVDDGIDAQLVSPREVVVARLVAGGHTNVEIANLLGLSLRSIETSRARLRQRLGLRTRADLVRFARGAGWAEDTAGAG
jgi:PAS domain S-box-containing protein